MFETWFASPHRPALTKPTVRGWQKALLLSLTLFSGAAFADADLLVNQTGPTQAVPAGGVATYTITTSNSGPDTATGIQLTDTLPSGTTFVSYTSSQGTCSAAGSTLTCNFPDLPFTQPLATITTQVSVRLPAVGVYTNTVTGSTTSVDNNTGNNQNIQANATAVAASDLAMNATASSSTVVAGQAYNYQLNISNNGPDNVDSNGNIFITFSVPTGSSITSQPSGSGWSCTPTSGYPLSSGSIVCTGAPLNNGATSSTVTVNAVANATGSIAAAFSASAKDSNGNPVPDGNSANDTATVSVTSSTGSDVAISGSVNSGNANAPAVVAQGGTATFTMVPRFNGGVAPGSTGSGIITVTSTLDPNLSYVPGSAVGTGWACGASGQVLTCTMQGPYTGGNYTNMPSITYQATANAAGTLVSNLAINAPETDPNTANNAATVSLQSSNSADLGISKTSSLNPVVPGQNYNYTLAVRNNGLLDVAAGQTITVTDNIPAGINLTAAPSGSGWACSPSGATAGPTTVTCTRPGPLTAYSNAPNITLPVTMTAAGTIPNTASVALSGTGPVDDNAANNSSTSTVTASGTGADLSIVKSASGTVDAGGNLTYTLAVANAGPDASTNVQVTDALGGLISTGGLQSVTTSQGTCTPDTSGGPVNGTSQNVSCNLGTLNANGTATITIVVKPTIATTGQRNNTASVYSPDIGDPNQTNNSSSVSSTVTAVADLAVTKTATPNPVAAGAPLTYVVTVSNNGPSTASAVTMTDNLPANATFINVQNVSNGGTCTPPAAGAAGGTLNCQWPSINNGSQRTVTYRVRPETSAINGTVDNAVSVATTTKETNLTNNSASTSTPVGPTQLDVQIQKTHTPDPVQLGQNTTYTVTVTNNGPSLATGVVMTDIMPDPNPPQAPTAIFSYQGQLVATQGGTCTEPAIGATNGTITCTFPSLDAQQTATVTYQEKAESITQVGAATGTTFNYASVKANETETTMANNQVSDRTTTFRNNVNADLAVVKTLTAPTNGVIIPGQQAVYSMVVTNNGPDTSVGAQLVDALPQGVTFVSAPGCNLNGNTVLCDLGTMAAQATQTFTLTVTAHQPYDGANPLVNTAQVDAPGDPNTANNTSSASGNVLVVSAVPTLSEWMLGLLAAVMLLFGGLYLARRA